MTSDVVTLRDVREADLPVFYQHQQDGEAARMAGFDPRAWVEFVAHWGRVWADLANHHQTVLVDGQVAGNVLSFVVQGEREVGYWIGREYWGRGIASRALALFLVRELERPLFAHVVTGNARSMRVLEKNGFQRLGQQGEEVIFRLDLPPTRETHPDS